MLSLAAIQSVLFAPRNPYRSTALNSLASKASTRAATWGLTSRAGSGSAPPGPGPGAWCGLCGISHAGQREGQPQGRSCDTLTLPS